MERRNYDNKQLRELLMPRRLVKLKNRTRTEFLAMNNYIFFLIVNAEHGLVAGMFVNAIEQLNRKIKILRSTQISVNKLIFLIVFSSGQ